MKIKNKISIKDQTFWKNFFGFLFIFFIIVIIIGLSNGHNFQISLNYSYIFCSFFVVVYAGGRIARDFVESDKIEEFISKNNLSREEFRKKYGELLEVLRRK